MPMMEYGYMEGEQLGSPYDPRILRRLAVYVRPHLRLLILAALVILGHTGLDLLLPYLTRTAIDSYMVRQALRVEVRRLPPKLLARLRQGAPDALAAQGGAVLYVPDSSWRKLDPRLAQGVKAAGALAARPWHIAPPGEETRRVAAQYPTLFQKVGGKWLIPADDLARLAPADLRRLRAPDAKGLVWLAVLFMAAAGAGCALGFSQYVMLERVGQEVMFTIRSRLYGHLLGRSLDFFSENPVGKLVTRLSNDVANLNEMYRTTLVAFCQDLFLVAGIVVVLLVLDWRLALICLALTPFIAAMAYIFARLARNAFRDLQGNLGRLNSRISETLAGLAAVKLFRAEADQRREFQRLNQAHYRAGMRQIRIFSVFMPLTEFFSGLAVALIIWYGGGQAVAERISLGTLVAFIFYMQMFFRPVRDMAEKYNIMQAAMASAERIFQLLDNRRSLPEADPPAPIDPDGPGEVRFENVSYGYDPQRPVVQNVSFAIPPGETWALVGPTGAGKTTLVNLLPRFFDPDQGRVLIDGVEPREMSPADLARMAAVVPQEVFLFSGTVEDNITLGRKEVTPQRLKQALEVSGAAQWVHGLDQGLQTQLGEGARRLSAGQRQILSLARALAGDPRVLVLDEATSSVDPESERLIQEALPRVMTGRTCLVVAHRLSTVRWADNILVMQGGRVVEQGRHQELMKQNGVYARLVQLQELQSGFKRMGSDADD